MILLEGRVSIMDSDERLACVREGTSLGASVNYVGGKPVKYGPLRFTIRCNVQPMVGQSLTIVPEADKYSDGLVLFVPATPGMTMIQLNDMVLRNGIVYQCQVAADWGSFTQANLKGVDVGRDLTALFAPVEDAEDIMTLTGNGAPNSSIGSDGDIYFDVLNLVFFGPKVSGSWPTGKSLKGADGNTIRYGSVDPASNVGYPSDYYINLTSKTFFGPKGQGAWPAGFSMVGPAGPAGSSGSGGSGGSGGGGSGGSGSSPTLYYLYQDALQHSWINDYNYGGTYATAADTRNSGVALSGNINQYGALNLGNLNGANVNVNDYLGVQFDAKAASGTPQIRVQLDSGDVTSPAVSKLVTLTNAWSTYTVLYTDSGTTDNSTSTSSFTNLELVNLNSTPTGTILFNNVALLVNPSPPVPTYTVVAQDSAPAATYASRLYVKGNKFYHAADDTIWSGRGLNCPDTRLDGKSYTNTQTTVATELKRRIGWAAGQGVDFFRLLLDQRNSQDDVVNNANYLAATKDVVNYIGSLGCQVMISCWNDYTASPYGSGQSGQPTVTSFTHWTQLATSFRNSGHVMFALCNEPRGNTTTQQKADYLAVVNQLVGVIRGVEARDGVQPHIIVVQGPTSYSRGIDYFVTNPVTDAAYPIVDATSTGYIAYEYHNYEAQSYWNNNDFTDWQHPAATLPVIIGEFAPNASGGTMLLDSTHDDVTPFMAYANAQGITYCGWTFDHDSSPDMILNHITDGSYGVGMTLEWTQPWGLKFINLLRAQKGLAAVNEFGV